MTYLKGYRNHDGTQELYNTEGYPNYEDSGSESSENELDEI
jgi:hypothetical protein